MRRLAVGLAIATFAAVALSWAQADDQQIARQITERLKHEQQAGNLKGFDIDLKVADGKVLIKGHVSTPKQQELLMQVAREIKGVKDVVNDLTIRAPETASVAKQTTAKSDQVAKTAKATPAGSKPDGADKKPTDQEIAKQIAAKLGEYKKSGALQKFNIGLSVVDGAVELKGYVADAQQQKLALEVAQRTPHVARVINKLAIQAPKQSIAAKKPAMEKAAAAPEKATNVDSEPAVASADRGSERKPLLQNLFGGSNSARNADWQPSPSEEVAEATKPSSRQATTEKDTKQVDDAIAQRIASELKRHQTLGNLKNFDIQLSVDHGEVVLNGRVADEKQLQLALQAAKLADGVRNVSNQILVVSPTPLPAVTQDSAATKLARTGAESSHVKQMLSRQETPRQAPASLNAPIDSLPEVHIAELQAMKPAATASSVAATQPAAPQSPAVPALQASVPRRSVAPSSQTPLPTHQLVNHDASSDSVSKPLATAEFHSEPTPAIQREPAAFDQDLGRMVMHKLRIAKEQGDLRGFGIGVHVKDAEVCLKGSVSSPEQIDLAVQAANSVPGVRRVINQLAINEKAGESSAQFPAKPEPPKVDSLKIAREINETLLAEEKKGNLDGSKMDVQVKGSQVVLKGVVASPDQKELALEISRMVPGVTQVVDGLRIRESLAKSNGMYPHASQLARLATTGSVPPNHSLANEATVAGNGQPTEHLLAAGNGQGASHPQLPQPAAGPLVHTNPASATTIPKVGQPARQSAQMVAQQPAMAAQVSYGPAAMQAPQMAAYPQMAYAQPYAAAYQQAGYGMQPAMPASYAMDQTPRPLSPVRMAAYAGAAAVAAPFMAIGQLGGGAPAQLPGPGHAVVPARYDHPSLPGYAWPSYAAHPNYAGVTYPKQYSPSAWPYIGPFYPYPQVPLGWRKVYMKWDDGWWMLDFKAK